MNQKRNKPVATRHDRHATTPECDSRSVGKLNGGPITASPGMHWRIRHIVTAILAVLAVAFAASPRSASAQSSVTVPNFSFETPTLSANSFSYGATGATWAINSAAGLSTNGSGFTGANPNTTQGNQVLFLQGGGAVATQSISGLTAGTVYTVTYSAAVRAGFTAPTWDVRVDGTTVASNDPGSAATSYVDYTASFTATSSSHTLGFFGTDNHHGDSTVFVDNVRITYTGGATGTGLSGAYFANISLSGTPALTRTDATVNFDWNGAQPDPAVPASNFSTRWTGFVQPAYSQTYTFYTNSDDGVRLWVNGVQLVNNWTLHGPTEDSGTITLTAGQKYAVTMEFYQGGGGAVAQLSWSSSSVSKAIIPTASLFPSSNGLKGEYFSNKTLTGGPSLTRVDGTVNFDWNGAQPDPAVPAFDFSARWTGQVLANYTETYTFYTNSDDGVRLWVNGSQLVNNWTDHGPTENSGTITLTAGQKYDVTMEFYQGGGGAVAQLSWSSASTSKAIIPQINLTPAGGNGPTVPIAPSGLLAVAASNTVINLSWADNSTDETGFKLERKTGSGGTYAQVVLTAANATSYQDTGLSTATQYYYRVRATNSAGDSTNSPETNATTMSGPPPAAPSGLTATAVSNSQINLAWTDNSNNENLFKIQRKTGSGGTYSQIGLAFTNDTTYSDSSLTAGTTYYYRVVSNNTIGDSSLSNEANATTTGGGSPPAAPSSLNANAVSSSQINLAWTDNASNETGFKVERKTGAGGTYAQIATPAANATSYSSTGLASSTQYYYRVRATNANGDSAFSAEANATTSPGGSPAGTGLRGDYYPNQQLLSSPTLTRTDATVNFSWGGSPGGSLPSDQFSVRWSGQVQPEFSQTYLFYTNVDDGARLWVNGVLLVDDWFNHPLTESVGSISLTGGTTYDIVMEYYDSSGGAQAQLSWSSPSQAKQIIPTLRLYPAAAAGAVKYGALYQLITKYWDGYGGNYASTYVFVQNPGGPANNAPVVNTISASPSTVGPGGTVSLSASATDADGDPLEYLWVAPAGSLGWSKAANDTWKAPTVGGTYSLQVMVGDGKSYTSRWVDVFVNANGNNVSPGNHIGSMTSLKASKSTVAVNEGITITATQTDRDPRSNGWYHYQFYATGGSVSDGGEIPSNSITWTAPSFVSTPGGRIVKGGVSIWPRIAPDQATCPFPLSTTITGIGLTGRCSRQHFADTFMPSWAQDGSLFTPWQDGGLITDPFTTIENGGIMQPNNPMDNRNGWAKLEGDDPMDLMTTHAGTTDRLTLPYGSFCYPGAAFTKDGVYYYGLRDFRITNNSGTPSTWEDGVKRLFPTRYLGFNVSTDGGATWTMCPYSESNPLINEPDPLHCKFGQLQPVDFGKNQQYSPDGKVYFVSNGSLSSDTSIDPLNDDHIFLCRATVSASGINNIANWEFYGSGTWKTAANNGIADATPIATWENHFTGVSAVYNPGLNKYLLIGNKGEFSTPTSTTIHLEDDDTFILESSSLTGPWNMAMYWNSFGAQAYYGNIPSKFISADGRTAWLWYGANFELGVKPEDPFGSGYRLTQHEIRFLTAADLQ